MHPYVKYQDMYDGDVVDETRHFVATDRSMKPITARGGSQLYTRGVTQSTQRSWTTGTKRQRGRADADRLSMARRTAKTSLGVAALGLQEMRQHVVHRSSGREITDHALQI